MSESFAWVEDLLIQPDLSISGWVPSVKALVRDKKAKFLHNMKHQLDMHNGHDQTILVLTQNRCWLFEGYIYKVLIQAAYWTYKPAHNALVVSA